MIVSTPLPGIAGVLESMVICDYTAMRGHEYTRTPELILTLTLPHLFPDIPDAGAGYA